MIIIAETSDSIANRAIINCSILFIFTFPIRLNRRNIDPIPAAKILTLVFGLYNPNIPAGVPVDILAIIEIFAAGAYCDTVHDYIRRSIFFSDACL